MPGQFSRQGGGTALMAGLPLDFFLALAVTAPTTVNPGTEYAATGYARQAVRRSGPPFASDPPTVENIQTVVFGPFTGAVGDTVTHLVAFQTVQDGGQYIAWWELDDPKTPVVGDSLVLDLGALTFSCL